MASAAGGVVDGHAELVAAEEPLERAHGLPPVPILTGRHLGFDEGLDQRGGVQRLLVALLGPRRGRLARVPPAVADEPDGLGVHSALGRVPVEGLESAAEQGQVAQPTAGGDQRLRQPGVVVGEHVLEPDPAGLPTTVEPPGEPTSEARQGVAQRRRQSRQVRPGEAENRERHLARAAGAAQGAAHLRHPVEAAGHAESPDRPSQVVAVVRPVQPALMAVEEVVHQGRVAIPRPAQERDRAVPDARERRIAEDPFQSDRDDRETGHVVDAVPGREIRLPALGMLDDADVVDEPHQVVGPDVRRGGEAESIAAGSRRSIRRRLREHRQRRLAHARPGQFGTDPSRLRPSRRQGLRGVEKVQHRIGQGPLVAERHQPARAGCQQVLSVEVRCRDHRATGGDREGERPGDDLLPGPVGRQVEVGAAQQPGQLVDRQEPVEEAHLLVETKITYETGQSEPIALPLVVDHVRMGLTGHQVQDLWMGRGDGGQGADRHLQALGGRDEAEGGDHGLGRLHREGLVADREQVGQRLVAAVITPGRLAQHVRRAVRHHAYAVRIRQPLGDDHPPGRLGEHHHAVGAVAQCAEGPRLGLGGLGQHRVQGDDDGHRQSLGQPHDMTAGLAAEDAELVLDHDRVDASPVEVGGGRGVVVGDALSNGADHVRRNGGPSLSHHGDDLDLDRGVGLEHRVAEVIGEDRDAARSRRVGGHDGHPHRDAPDIRGRYIFIAEPLLVVRGCAPSEQGRTPAPPR